MRTRPGGIGAGRVALGLTVALGLAACGRREAPEDPHPTARNVLLFTVDTLRADALGSYGHPDAPTPHADSLAAEGLRFDKAYSQATLTNSSLTSILTGLLPIQTGVHIQADAFAAGTLPVPLVLQAEGIATGSFIANMCKLQETESTVYHDGWDTRFCGMLDDPENYSEQYLWDQAVVDAALDWIEQQDGPWFCWVHLMDPHAEHRPPPQLWDWEARPPREKQAQYHYYADFEEQRAIPPDDVRQRLLEMYSAEVRGSDEQFGRALGALRARPDWDSTAVLFSSDHGEELFETWFRYDHGMSMTEGVFRVPLIVRAPGVDPGVEPRIVEALQISPTVLGLFDVDAPYELAGPSLLASNPSLGYALSYGSDITTSIRGGKYRFWLRHRKRPFERDFSPWRHEAPWFQNKRSLASYSDSNGVLPTWADPTEPDLVPTVKKLERALERRHKDVKQADGVRVNDPEYLKRLIELGYTDPTELGLSDEEFERLRAEVGQQD